MTSADLTSLVMAARERDWVAGWRRVDRRAAVGNVKVTSGMSISSIRSSCESCCGETTERVESFLSLGVDCT